MSVRVQFNHHYTLNGWAYLPGDVTELDEADAAPVIYAAKAHLVAPEYANSVPPDARVAVLGPSDPIPPDMPKETVIVRRKS